MGSACLALKEVGGEYVIVVGEQLLSSSRKKWDSVFRSWSMLSHHLTLRTFDITEL